MARSMLSLGMLAPLAFCTASRSRGLASGSGPLIRAATVTSLMILVNTFPRFASSAPFLRLIVAHLLCPDIRIALVTNEPARYGFTLKFENTLSAFHCRAAEHRSSWAGFRAPGRSGQSKENMLVNFSVAGVVSRFYLCPGTALTFPLPVEKGFV